MRPEIKWCLECKPKRRIYTRVILETRPDSKYWSEDPTQRKRPVRHCRKCGRWWDFDTGRRRQIWRDRRGAPTSRVMSRASPNDRTPVPHLPRGHFRIALVDPLYHTRSGSEQCWLALRGRGYRRQNMAVEQVLFAPIREHSRKPDEVRARIDRLVGDVPRIELFAREQAPGWHAWGDELRLNLFGGRS
jgi:hypothetical protein